MEETIDSMTCPFCGEKNGCMAQSSEPCWCNDIVVPDALVEMVPAPVKGQACVCRSCIESYRLNPDIFQEFLKANILKQGQK